VKRSRGAPGSRRQEVIPRGGLAPSQDSHSLCASPNYLLIFNSDPLPTHSINPDRKFGFLPGLRARVPATKKVGRKSVYYERARGSSEGAKTGSN
jgi:hypothetical protein